MGTQEIALLAGLSLSLLIAVSIGISAGLKRRGASDGRRQENQAKAVKPEPPAPTAPKITGRYQCGACGHVFYEYRASCPSPTCRATFSETRTVESPTGCLVPMALLIAGNLLGAVLVASLFLIGHPG